MKLLKAGFLPFAAALLAACSTPGPVLELADKTAANVGVLGAQMRRIEQEGRALAETRAANIAQLHAANARLRAEYTYDVELTKKGGGRNNLDLMKTIENWGNQVDQIFVAADGAQARRSAEILATRTTLDTKSTELAKIAETLASLAKEDSRADRTRFLVGFAQQLKKEVDVQIEKGDESAKAAKELIDKVKTF